jgi:hypothetical protein
MKSCKLLLLLDGLWWRSPTHASIQAGCAEREREAIFLVASFGFDNIPVISSYIFRFDVSHDATRVI